MSIKGYKKLIWVVFIVGILLTVALPRYYQSVEKKAAEQIYPQVKELTEAVRACRAAVGTDEVTECMFDDLHLKFLTSDGALLTNSTLSARNGNPTYLTDKWAIHKSVSGAGVDHYTFFRAPYAGTYFCGFDVNTQNGVCSAFANTSHPKGVKLMQSLGYAMTSAQAVANASGNWRRLPC